MQTAVQQLKIFMAILEKVDVSTARSHLRGLAPQFTNGAYDDRRSLRSARALAC